MEMRKKKRKKKTHWIPCWLKTYDWFPQGLCDYHYLQFFIFTSTLDILGTEVEQHADQLKADRASSLLKRLTQASFTCALVM